MTELPVGRDRSRTDRPRRRRATARTRTHAAGVRARRRRRRRDRRMNPVRLFSRWSELVDPAARSSSSRTGGAPPTEMRTRPDSSGGSSTSNPSPPPSVMRCSSVPRWSASPDAAATWSSTPAARPTLSIHLRRPGGSEDRVFAQAVVDASGTWGTPNRSAGKDCPPSARRLPDPRSPTVCPISTTRQFVLGSPGSTLSSQVAAIPH